MGVIATSDSPFAAALGQYLLAFSDVEASLALLFSFLRSENHEEPGTWDSQKQQDALQEIGRRNLSVGQLAKETEKLIKKLVPPAPGVLERWRRLRELGEPLVKHRNDVVHRHLVTMEDVLDEPLTGIVLSTDEEGQPTKVLTAHDLLSQAAQLRNLTFHLQGLVSELLTERVASASEG